MISHKGLLNFSQVIARFHTCLSVFSTEFFQLVRVQDSSRSVLLTYVLLIVLENSSCDSALAMRQGLCARDELHAAQALVRAHL